MRRRANLQVSPDHRCHRRREPTKEVPVSKWLGHSSYVLTLTTYADYISEDEPVPPRLARPITAKRGHNVVTLDRTAL
jgi:hypothetical protein